MLCSRRLDMPCHATPCHAAPCHATPHHATLRSASENCGCQRNVWGASRAGLPGGGFAMARFLRDCLNKKKAYPKHKESHLVKIINIHNTKQLQRVHLHVDKSSVKKRIHSATPGKNVRCLLALRIRKRRQYIATVRVLRSVP